MIRSPVKRKREAIKPCSSDEYSDVESYDIATLPSIKKKTRFREYNDEETESLRETVTATAAGTDTPITEASSARGKNRVRPKIYICSYPDCTKAFDRPIRLQTHINSHTGERPHVCQEPGCDKSFFKSEHLKQHIHDKHTEYQGFHCTYPIHDEEKGTIAECGKTFPTSSKLKRHIVHHEEKEETRCSWAGCGKVFRKQETLQRHLKKDHLNELPYQCTHASGSGEICGEAFATPSQLKSHKMHEHEAPKYRCEICSDALNSRTIDYMATDDLLNSASFSSADGLNTFGDDFDDTIIRSLTLEDAATASMRRCGNTMSFTTYAELQLHNKMVHPPTCTECSKQCKSNRELKAHIEIEHPDPHSIREPGSTKEAKKFLCPFEDCDRAEPGNGFTRRGNMDVHIKTVHVKQKHFVCGEFDLGASGKVEGWNGQGCGFALGTKQSLIAHIRTQHLGVQAAIGARTGLRDEDRKRSGRKVKKEIPEMVDDGSMDVDSTPPPFTQGNALSLLTGAGYEAQRPIPCLLANSQGCQMRFVKGYDLGMHLELTHGWNVDDINEALGGGLPTGNVDFSERSDMIDPRLQGVRC